MYAAILACELCCQEDECPASFAPPSPVVARCVCTTLSISFQYCIVSDPSSHTPPVVHVTFLHCFNLTKAIFVVGFSSWRLMKYCRRISLSSRIRTDGVEMDGFVGCTGICWRFSFSVNPSTWGFCCHCWATCSPWLVGYDRYSYLIMFPKLEVVVLLLVSHKLLTSMHILFCLSTLSDCEFMNWYLKVGSSSSARFLHMLSSLAFSIQTSESRWNLNGSKFLCLQDFTLFIKNWGHAAWQVGMECCITFYTHA